MKQKIKELKQVKKRNTDRNKASKKKVNRRKTEQKI